MENAYPLLKPLTEQFMKEVQDYGILEVSLEQYQAVCNSILRFATEVEKENYCTPQLLESYKKALESKCSAGMICKEYARFQNRVVRMISSLSDTGKVDFSRANLPLQKYVVSEDALELVEEILDSYPISDKTKKDLRAPTRHFLWYAEQRDIVPTVIDDTLVMDFLINEIPITNGGSTGRTLRCVKYATEYLKKHGNQSLHRDYRMLKLKNDHRRIIPAYSEEEISGIVAAADKDTMICKRDLAIILLAYCTGLRGIDIISIRADDINWRTHKVSIVQSKTQIPVIAELNGSTMNALADYILEWRPRCDISEIFVTVKAPYHRLSKGFGSMIDKYCKKADVPKIALRGFHSIRRAFETIMVSRGVPIEIASQMLGHQSISEDKPYITHDKCQISFVALDFSDVPISVGFYSDNNGNASTSFREGGAGK